MRAPIVCLIAALGLSGCQATPFASVGGFPPRARHDTVALTHVEASGAGGFVVPLGTSMIAGDTVFVGERWV